MKKWKIKLFIQRHKPHDVEEYSQWWYILLPDGWEPMCVASREKVS